MSGFTLKSYLKSKAFDIVLLLLFILFLGFCGFSTYKTYAALNEARPSVTIGFPEEGKVGMVIDQLCFLKDREKYDTGYQYVAELEFRYGFMDEGFINKGDLFKITANGTETTGEVISAEKNKIYSFYDVEFVYIIGFNSDSVLPDDKTVGVYYEIPAFDCDYTLPGEAVFFDTTDNYVYIVVPTEGVYGTEYVTRRVNLKVWPRNQKKGRIWVKEMPLELREYPVVLSTNKSLRSFGNDGSGVSVNLE